MATASRHEAYAVRNELAPFCDLCEVAGSFRRGALHAKDIEVVCVPRLEHYREFRDLVNGWKRIKGEAGGKYTRRTLAGGAELDLFVVNRATWPVQLVLRTGCADFSRALVTRASKMELPCIDGRLVGPSGALQLATEEDVFRALGVPYPKPEHRDEVLAARLARLPLTVPR
ncbi:MAG: hypothetical protein ACH37Z_14920 [Anaerolineae bacterium]